MNECINYALFVYLSLQPHHHYDTPNTALYQYPLLPFSTLNINEINYSILDTSDLSVTPPYVYIRIKCLLFFRQPSLFSLPIFPIFHSFIIIISYIFIHTNTVYRILMTLQPSLQCHCCPRIEFFFQSSLVINTSVTRLTPLKSLLLNMNNATMEG